MQTPTTTMNVATYPSSRRSLTDVTLDAEKAREIVAHDLAHLVVVEPLEHRRVDGGIGQAFAVREVGPEREARGAHRFDDLGEVLFGERAHEDVPLEDLARPAGERVERGAPTHEERVI